MLFPPKEIIDKLKEQYPEGTRVELVKMDDIQAPPVGTKGTITHIDDIGTIFCRWDNGSSLGVAYDEDEIRKVSNEKCQEKDTATIL